MLYPRRSRWFNSDLEIDPLKEFGLIIFNEMKIIEVIDSGINEIFEKMSSNNKHIWRCLESKILELSNVKIINLKRLRNLCDTIAAVQINFSILLQTEDQKLEDCLKEKFEIFMKK
ncbi:MAG: hypothetical protein MHMPM18_003475 [Marteilia pararefringens]